LRLTSGRRTSEPLVRVSVTIPPPAAGSSCPVPPRRVSRT
jgi:hypothetical protein